MYDFSFAYDAETGREEVFLPVPPDKIQAKVGSNNKTIDLLGAGESSVLKDLPLQEFSFDLLLPRAPYPFVQIYGVFRPPSYYLDLFLSFKRDRVPVQFRTAWRHEGSTEGDVKRDITVTVEDLSVEERAGETGDFYVSLSLREYKKIQTVLLQRVDEFTAAEEQAPDDALTEVVQTPLRDEKPPARTYTVQKDDCLFDICRKELGDGSRYPEIAALNGIKDPDKIQTGQVLLLG